MATTTRVLTASVNGTVYTTNANGALEAIDTCHSGATAPTNEVANGKLWLDTTTTPGILKMYNNAAWEVIGGSTSSPTFANLTTTGAITVSGTAGYGSLEVGGPSGALLDLKSPASDDYDARIIYNGGTNLQINTLAADEPILLRQGGSTKLATSSAGVDVTGNLTATGNLSGVNGTFTGDVTIGDDLNLTGPSPTITLTDNDTAAEYTKLYNSNGHTYIDSRNGATNGLIIFRGAGGGATDEYARFTAAGNFGIGNSTPAALLHVGSSDTVLGGTAGNDVNLLTLHADTSNSDLLQFTSERLTTGTSWTTAAHRIQRKVDAILMGYMQFGNNTSDLITFGKNATEYMRIDGSGNVDVTGEVTAASFAGDGSALTGISTTPTTAQVGTATAGLAVGAVGSYALLKQTVTSTVQSPGATRAGSGLDYTSAQGDGSTTSPGGTWRIMGAIKSSTGTAANTSIWLRIS